MRVSRHSNIQLPESLRRQLIRFRRRLWTLKLFEAFALAVIAILVGFLLTYLLDRLHDTAPIVRLIILSAAVVGSLAVPLTIQRWVIRRRRLDQLARLLAETHPTTGDPLLGVIELADDALSCKQADQNHSPQLVHAAISQVAAQVAQQDLSSAIPKPRHRQRGFVAAALVGVVAVLLVLTTPAASNAWVRFLAPWKPTPRYTFADVTALPETLVVAQDEPFNVMLRLKEASRWRPETAAASLPGQPPAEATLDQHQYKFDLPGQLLTQTLAVKVGDFRGNMQIEPKSRPELSSLVATVQLPDYLGRNERIRQEVRGSTMSVVVGSRATLTATASRPLADASVDGKWRPIRGDRFTAESMIVDQPTAIELQWRDEYGLTGKQPFELTINPLDDAAPTVVCEDLPKRKVLLRSEVLPFQVRAADDFGIKQVGMQWRSVDQANSNPETGEAIIGAGSVLTEQLDLAATFCAADQNVQSQTIAVRVFVEDYLPGRERSYSPESVFDVLSANQHAIWITSELVRWQRASLDARDRELRLHETNKELRSMSDEQLQRPENQARLARQAELERSGGHQLTSLARSGEELLKEAMRNPEIGVGHLDHWAEMIQTLKQIAGSRMPSVADLLAKAAKSSSAAASSAKQRSIGQNRLTSEAPGQPTEPSPEKPQPAPEVPSISDVESTHHDLNSEKSGDPSPSKPGQSRLTLPNTLLATPAKPPSDAGAKLDSTQQEIEQAVKEQQDLLAEFDKIADELNELLANLEGSTIVKRLKASSRRQQQVAARLAALAAEAFGVSDRKKELNADDFQELAAAEMDSSQQTSHIMDDMDAYFARSRMLGFRRVLDQMRQSDVTAELRLLSDELRKQNGLSISQAEYWSDTFDRWAEDLVGVCESGECPGGKSKGSLPPSVVLEVLKLLEGEVNLREQTRVAQQARPAVSHALHTETTERLWRTQDDFQQRADAVVDRIVQLPDAEADFGKEMAMLRRVSEIMQETVEILRGGDTGPRAIAAETEIIELLLESKRFSPSGGGGGAAPGGGGTGEMETPALALVGVGLNAKEYREAMSATQSTGTGGPVLPEEYRSGLDAYFNRLEAWRGGN